MKLTEQQREGLKALADAATPGPWRIGSLESYDGYSGKPYRNVWQGQDEDARTIARAILDQGNEQTDVDADAMFIAASREAVPALLADLEEVEARAGQAFRASNALRDDANQMAEELRSINVAYQGCLSANTSLQEELAAARQQLEQYKRDAERLDFLDKLNAALNTHYGTTYKWELVLSPNVVRLMSGPGGSGRCAAIDLSDINPNGAKSCREAIDALSAKEKSNEV